jgi:hypothetical protein
MLQGLRVRYPLSMAVPRKSTTGGNRSNQTDVVVTDEEQPFQVDESPQLFIIEGVAAAAEVKTKLTAQELRDCLRKAERFKALEALLGKATTLPSPTRRGNPNSDLLRFYRRRPFFVFAYEGATDQNTLLEMAASRELVAELDRQGSAHRQPVPLGRGTRLHRRVAERMPGH